MTVRKQKKSKDGTWSKLLNAFIIAALAAKRPNVMHRPCAISRGRRFNDYPHVGIWEYQLSGYKIRVEISNTQINRSRTRCQCWLNTLKRKGITAALIIERG